MRSLLLLFLFLAPIPPLRPIIRPPLHGEWRLSWGEKAGGVVLFRRDGTFRLFWKQSEGEEWREYEGNWKIDGDALHIEEWLYEYQEQSPIRYTLKMDRGKLSGTFGHSGTKWRLDKKR